MSAVAALVLYWICAGLIVAGIGLVLLPVLWFADALAVRSTLHKHNSERDKLIRAAIGN